MFCRRNVSHIMLFISRVHNFRALPLKLWTLVHIQVEKFQGVTLTLSTLVTGIKFSYLPWMWFTKKTKLSPTEHSSWMASNTSLLHWKSLVLLIYTALVHQCHMYSLVTLLQLVITIYIYITFCSSCVTVLITVQTHATGSLNRDA